MKVLKPILSRSLSILFVLFLFTVSSSGAEVIIGRWLEHAGNSTIRMDEQIKGFYGGWQTSGLTYDPHANLWWAIGDQNSREMDDYSLEQQSRRRGRYLYRIVFHNGSVKAEPIAIDWNPTDLLAVHNSFNNFGSGYIDFEAIACDVVEDGQLYAVTEGEMPWLVRMEYQPSRRRVAVAQVVRLDTTGNHDQYCTPNERWEGLAVSLDSRKIFLVTECMRSPSRLYEIKMEQLDIGEHEHPDEPRMPRLIRPKPMSLGILPGALTGLCLVSQANKPHLLVLKRNPEPAEIFVIDLGDPNLGIPVKKVQLDLRFPATDGRPGGIRLISASPEGIASDGNRVIIVSDPSPGFYKPLNPFETGTDERKMNNQIPLFFEIKLARILP